MTWHEFYFTCPDCKVAATIEQLSFASNGGILVEGYCPKCKKPIYFQTTAVDQAVKAQKKDNTPVTAFTDHDLSFLMEHNITLLENQ